MDIAESEKTSEHEQVESTIPDGETPVIDIEKEQTEPQTAQVEELTANLAELDYPQKMRMVEDLRESLLGAETRTDLEKFNIELNAQNQTLRESLKPLLFQLRRIFAPDKLSAGEQEAEKERIYVGAGVDENLEEPYKTLHEQYLKLEKFAEKTKNLPQDIEASYTTRKAVFELVARTSSFEELEGVLENNEAFITHMRLDFMLVGKKFKSDLDKDIESMVFLLRRDGTVDYDFSEIPTFLAEKIKELTPKFLKQETVRRAAEYPEVVSSAMNTLELQIWLRDLGWFVPEGSSVDAEELSLEVEAFWRRVSFDDSEKKFADLIPTQLNFPPINEKLIDLLENHPAYIEVTKMRNGEYNNNVGELIAALKKIGSNFVLSEKEGMTAGRMALVIDNLRHNWHINVKVPRNLAGFEVGKRRLSKEEITDKLTQGSLSFLNEEKNRFILNAIVESLDKAGRA